MVFPLDAPAAVYEQLQADVDRVWAERPDTLAYAHTNPLAPLSVADEASERAPSCRLADLHSHSDAALALYLDRTVFRHVERVLGQPPVATQSLFFEYGSQQGLHRDPVFVQHKPPSHLVAAWIALEDIDRRSGPLLYVPGSHRLPYYQFAPGEHRFDHSRHGAGETRAMEEHDRAQCAARGLPVVAFTPRRGEVLLWHHSLLHGGAGVEDPSLTRRSFVVHFASAAELKVRRQSIVERVPGPDGEPVLRQRILETARILERGGCRGFDNPLRGYRPPP
jgi:ectoine hydroxylase-related dioxygenase (phytanoyl-CoA dioxygenase family)